MDSSKNLISTWAAHGWDPLLTILLSAEISQGKYETRESIKDQI